MTIEVARGVGPARLDLAYERMGERDAPPVLLVMGVAAQLINWPDELCAALVARGLQLVRFDNRDSGESTHITGAPMPDIAAAMAGDRSSASYDLSDMAGDALGLMDALGWSSAHVVGASMGGAIAQTMAIEHPTRVRSLTTIMSSTGAKDVGQAAPAVLASFGGARPRTRDEVIEQAVRVFSIVGSPGFPVDEAAVRERAGRAYDRAYDPLGAARQGLAQVASGDRTAGLRGVVAPTLVIHGDADLVCDVSGGRATAAAVPGAEVMVIAGLGHNLPPGVHARIVDAVVGLVRRAEVAVSRAT